MRHWVLKVGKPLVRAAGWQGGGDTLVLGTASARAPHPEGAGLQDSVGNHNGLAQSVADPANGNSAEGVMVWGLSPAARLSCACQMHHRSA